jgi:hypothetical protein
MKLLKTPASKQTEGSYPLGQRFLLHFADATERERAMNNEVLSAIELAIQSVPAISERDMLVTVRGLLQRPFNRLLQIAESEPLVITDLNLTVRDLLMMFSIGRWPRPYLGFSCLNPHCHSSRDITFQQLHQHPSIYKDGLLGDWLVVAFAGLIGCRVDMSDATDFICPFYRCECKFVDKSFLNLEMHLKKHPEKAKRYFKTLSVFLGLIIYQCVQEKGWPRVGQILANRVPNMDTRIYPLDGDDAIDYWTETLRTLHFVLCTLYFVLCALSFAFNERL